MAEEPIVMQPGEGPVLEMPGEHFTRKLGSAQTGGCLTMSEWVIAPRHGTTEHTHAQSGEFFIVIDGTVTIDIDGIEHNVAAGSVAWSPPGARHRVTNLSETPATLIAGFAPAGAEVAIRAVAELVAQEGEPADPSQLEALLAQHGMEVTGPARMRVGE